MDQNKQQKKALTEEQLIAMAQLYGRFSEDVVMLQQDQHRKYLKNQTKPCNVCNQTNTFRDPENCDLGWFIERAKQELEELQIAIEDGDDYEALLEAADVANFMVFLHGKLRRMLKQKEQAQ